jgi:D-3-phosphoglycerate dehydrogenase / 2-oxoglutarate reductase
MVTASTSPTSITLHDRFRASSLDSSFNVRPSKILHPVEKDLRLLVLEDISQEAVIAFISQGFKVDHYKKAMSEDELVEKIKPYHAIGIRSKTKITKRVIKAAPKVCVCIRDKNPW